MATPGSAAWLRQHGIEREGRPETLEETRRRLDPEYFERRDAARALGGTLNTPRAVGYGDAGRSTIRDENLRREGDLHSLYIYLREDVGWYDPYTRRIENRDYWIIVQTDTINARPIYGLYLKQSYGR